MTVIGRVGTALVQLGTGLALAGAAHAAVNVRLLRRPSRPDVRSVSGANASGPHRVALLVPARNEASRIGACVHALLAQDVAEIAILDDCSTDGTAGIARAAAGADPRVRILAGAPLPAGWLGKPHACAQLAAAATGDVLVFLDADVLLAPGAITAAVALLVSGGLDLISPHPRQIAETVSERLVQPLLQFSIIVALPLRVAETSRRASLSAANGQFMVVTSAAYERCGGHSAIRAEVLDDIALIRAVKAAGGTGGIVDGTELASCRMYDGWGQLRAGYGKSLWTAFGSEPGAAAVTALLATAYVGPAVAALGGSRVGAVGYLAGVLSRIISARATGGRSWPDAFAHPLSISVFGYLTAHSIVAHRRGTLSWKNRPLR